MVQAKNAAAQNVGWQRKNNTGFVSYDEKKRRMVQFGLCLGAVLLLFGTDCVPEYTTDTYSTFANSGAWRGMIFNNGRVLTGVIYFIVEKLFHSNPTFVYYLSYAAAILCLTSAIYIYVEELNPFIRDTVLAVFTGVLVLSNLFYIEYFLFIEKGVFSIALLLTVLAFRHTRRFAEYHNKKDLISVMLLLLMTVFLYQVFLGLYVILCLPLIIKYTHDIKSFLRGNIAVFGTYAVIMGIGLLVTRFVLHSSRVKRDSGLSEVISSTFSDIRDTFLTSGRIAPGWFLPLCLLLALAFSVIYIRKSRKKLGFFTLPYILFVVTAISFAPYFLGTTNDIYAIRIKYPFAAMTGILLVNIFVNFNLPEENERKRKQAEAPLLVFCAASFLIQAACFVTIFVDRYKTNQMDKYLCYLTIQKIAEYQDETGNEVTMISIYSDARRSWSHHGLNSSLLNTRAHVQNWSDVSSISFYAGKQFKRGGQNENYRNYFAGRDWNLYNEDQYIFDGNTLHWCIY